MEVRDRKARNGCNPQTGKKLTIPVTKAPVISAGKVLKEQVKD
ncbi:HU family DNA-binding protein [Acaryochloris sp. CCMEE 5410]